jgi:hypothetical protein
MNYETIDVLEKLIEKQMVQKILWHCPVEDQSLTVSAHSIRI